MKRPTTDSEKAGQRRAAPITVNFEPLRCLRLADELGLLTCIEAGERTPQGIERASGVSARGAAGLLNLLCAMGWLNKTVGGYSLAPHSRPALKHAAATPDARAPQGRTKGEWKWRRLAECVRTGRPYQKIGEQQGAEEYFPLLVQQLYDSHQAEAARLGERLRALHSTDEGRILDLACGSGVWGLTAARGLPGWQVTLQDFPGVLEISRKYVDQLGLGGRVEYLAGSMKEVGLGEERFDIAILGNILHCEGEAACGELILRVGRAIRPGGTLAIIDTVPNEERTGPLWPLAFALNMLMHTEEGGTYTVGEISAWLRAAGLSVLESETYREASTVILGRKP